MPSKYALVILAAKRARQVKDGAKRLTDSRSANPLTVALEEIGVHVIEAHARHHGRVEHRSPLAAHLAHDDVGRHVLHVARAVAPTGARVEMADA